YAAIWDHIRYPDLRVYGGLGSGIYRSTDAGTTWSRLSNGLPAPSKDVGRIGIAVAPSNPNRLYAIVIDTDGTFQGLYRSNDGGAYRSTANGSTWTHATVEPFTQFYSVDVSEQDNTRVVGGAQDNGGLRSYPGNWNAWIGGDGEEALIDPANQNNTYGCFQY